MNYNTKKYEKKHAGSMGHSGKMKSSNCNKEKEFQVTGVDQIFNRITEGKNSSMVLGMLLISSV